MASGLAPSWRRSWRGGAWTWRSSYNRSVEEAETTVAAIRALGRQSFAIQADLSRPGECAALVDQAAAALGGLDVLINMASIYRTHTFEELDERRWNESIGVDLGASYFCARAAVPHMRKAGGGRIVNFSDWIAASGRPRYKGYLSYYVAKRAVIGLTEALALELAEEQILVNAIAPGPILAPESVGEDEFKAVESATPLGRWGGEVGDRDRCSFPPGVRLRDRGDHARGWGPAPPLTHPYRVRNRPARQAPC